MSNLLSTAASNLTRDDLSDKQNKELITSLLFSPLVSSEEFLYLSESQKIRELNSDEMHTLLSMVNGNIEETRRAFSSIQDSRSLRAHPGYKSIIRKVTEIDKKSNYKITLTDLANLAEFYAIDVSYVLADYGFQIVTPSSLKGYLDMYVIGQEAAKISYSTTFYTHLLRGGYLGRQVNLNLFPKAHLVVVGPTGTGKSLKAKVLTRLFLMPNSTLNLSRCVSNGYVGMHIDEAFTDLFLKCGGDLSNAQKGLVIFDEIDKIKSKPNDSLGSTDLQEELLDILEGSKISIATDRDRHPNRTQFDVLNLCIIMTGAFTGIEKVVRQNRMTGNFGFKIADDNPIGRKNISPHDLETWGMMPELVGRISKITHTNKLEIEELRQILLFAKDNALSSAKEYFQFHNINVVFEYDAINEIAKAAHSYGLGARYLSNAVNGVLDKYQFTAPELSGKEIIITADEVLESMR